MGQPLVHRAWLCQLCLLRFPPDLLRRKKKKSDEKGLILARDGEDRGSDALKKV